MKVIFFLVALAFTSSIAFASTSSSWTSKPNWALEDPGITPLPKKKGQSRSRLEDLSEREQPAAPFAPGSHNASLDLGQTFLMGDLGAKYSDNIGFQGHYVYGVSELFAFDSSLGYSSHSDGKYSLLTMLTGLRTNLTFYDRVIPHLVMGLGFYKPSVEIITEDGKDVTSLSPVLFGLHLGPGVDLQINRTVFFGTSLTFHNMFGDRRMTARGPIDLGGTYTTFFVRSGVTF